MPFISGQITEIERDTMPGNKKVKVYERGSQFDILARVPGSYMWVSPIPNDLLARNGLVQKKCFQSPVFSDLLIYSEQHQFQAQELAFIDCLKNSVKNILADYAFH